MGLVRVLFLVFNWCNIKETVISINKEIGYEV